MKRSFFHDTASFLVVLLIVFIPFPFHLTKVQSPVTDFIFGRLIGFVSQHIFGKILATTRVYSDSTSMYILVVLLFIVAALISIVLLRIKKWPQSRGKIIAFIYQLCLYYLALQLLKYGLGKIFKSQFYLPEPNTLYTPIGEVSKSLLFWSSMGTSWFYNFFLGSVEVLAALLLFIKRTRLVGLLVTLGTLLNVAAINFGFDISVKLYSLFLVYLTLYLSLPYFDKLKQLLLRTANPIRFIPEEVVVTRKSFLAAFATWLIMGVIFLEAFYPFIKSNNFNDDLAKRPYLHGAYEVRQVIAGSDTLGADESPVKRFFIHKMGYIIFQDQEEEMQDFKLSYNKSETAFILTDYQFRKTTLPFTYQQADSVLILPYIKAGKEYKLISKALDWRKLPAVQKDFHWTVDGRQ